MYYTYTAVLDGLNVEACDPYARTTGVNGKRAMVIDLDSTDPAGWENDKNPHASESINDAVIYELHIRDFSADVLLSVQSADHPESAGTDYQPVICLQNNIAPRNQRFPAPLNNGDDRTGGKTGFADRVSAPAVIRLQFNIDKTDGFFNCIFPDPFQPLILFNKTC